MRHLNFLRGDFGRAWKRGSLALLFVASSALTLQAQNATQFPQWGDTLPSVAAARPQQQHQHQTEQKPQPQHQHQTEPKQAKPKQTEPKQTAPKQAQPQQTEPKQAEPTTEATPAPAPVDHSQHTGGAKQPTTQDPHAAHGAGISPASRPAHHGDDLMLMDGAQMSVRVGRSANSTPMGQMGSGTSWQPVTSPMHMWHKRAGEWLLMFHGEAKIGVNHQSGPRGLTKFESQNWFMPMAFRRVGAGTLQLRGMFSLEPWTFSGKGSPQLFQTGEAYQGRPLVDAQHPHDLFMELSAQYTLPVGERANLYAYVGYPGEPTLGPPAFMHRASAAENPTAPLSHHLQDSTHISFGVLTTGFTYRWLKLEGSVFNGREPDERRANFEYNPWNSRSARVTVAPNENWAMQFSYGLLKNPELLSEGDTRRMTASVQYNKRFERGNWASAFIWGRNREEHEGEVFRLNGYTAESTLSFLDRNYLYTRLELVDREGDHLLSHEELHGLGFGEDAHPQFRIGAYTFGAARDLWTSRNLSVALGGDFTFYTKPEILDAIYGRRPTAYKFFLRLRPSASRGHESHSAEAGGGNVHH